MTNNDFSIEELLFAALQPVRKELLRKIFEPFHHGWSPETGIEFTLTIAEARDVLNALYIAEGEKPRKIR